MEKFTNRKQAGQALIPFLPPLPPDIIIALPRGGVETAFPVAKHFHLPIYLCYIRKIRAKNNPELAIGAIDAYGDTSLNHTLIHTLNISEAYLQDEIQYQTKDIQDRITKYGALPPNNLRGKRCLIIDDGMATGYTMNSACQSLLRQEATVYIAVPVCSKSAYDLVNKNCEVFSVHIDTDLGAIGNYYDDFSQTTDETVRYLVNLAQNFR